MKKGFDGVLGLAPNSYQNGPCFIKKLSDLGTIPEAVVSYQITPNQNLMQIGFVNDASYSGELTYHSIVQAQNTWWTLNLGDVTYDGQSIKTSNLRYAIIDSGSRMIMMAEDDYKNFVDNIPSAAFSRLDCTGLYCFSDSESCKFFESKLSDFTFTLDSTVYSVPPTAYLSEGFNGHKCAITVSFVDWLVNRYVLGDAFIKNYYVTFDFDNNQVGLALNADGPVSFETGLLWWELMLIILGCLLIIFLIFAGILYRRAQNKTVTSVLEDDLDEQVKNEPLIGFD